VVPLEVLLQIAGMYVARVAIVSGADEGAAILVGHLVIIQGSPFAEGRTTIGNFANVRPLTSVRPFVLSGIP
jgi:hypothetical protein